MCHPHTRTALALMSDRKCSGLERCRLIILRFGSQRLHTVSQGEYHSICRAGLGPCGWIRLLGPCLSAVPRGHQQSSPAVSPICSPAGQHRPLSALTSGPWEVQNNLPPSSLPQSRWGAVCHTGCGDQDVNVSVWCNNRVDRGPEGQGRPRKAASPAQDLEAQGGSPAHWDSVQATEEGEALPLGGRKAAGTGIITPKGM